MMTNPTKREIKREFTTEYKGHKNIFTPIAYLDNFGYSLKNPNLFFEISEGDGMFNDHLVGVTVLEMPERKRRHDLNECFSGNNKQSVLSAARKYAESLS